MEDILSRTGWGLYSNMLTGYAALCYFSNALSFMNLPLYLPMISCDVRLHENTLEAVDFCIYIGMAFGGFFFSALSDVIGRKTVISTTLLFIFVNILATSFSFGPFGLILAFLLFGASLEANLNVIKILVMETIQLKQRYYAVILLDVFWHLGTISCLGFYWYTSPVLIQYHNETQRFMNWRINILLSVLLCIFLACISSLLLDSPKYLLFERRPRDASEVLREIFAINKSKLFNNFQIAEGELHGKIMDFGISNERDIPNTISSKRVRIIFSRIHKSLLVLVRKQFLKSTLLAILFRLILSMGHLPIILLLARTLLMDDVYLPTDNYLLWHMEHPIQRDCDHFERNIHLYTDFTILCTFCISGYGILMLIIKYMERKYIMTSVLFLSGVFSLLLSVVLNNYAIRFVISAMFVIAYSMACSCLDLIILDMFPTAVRGTAMGETMIFARLANVFVIKYLTVPIQWVFIGFGCLMQFGAIMSFYLPTLANKPIVD